MAELSPSLSIKLEFSGGLEILFDNRKSHTISLPSVNEVGQAVCIRNLIAVLRRTIAKDQEEKFIDSDGMSIRPGILVVVNDTDWELMGREECTLEEGDEVAFISTLHGG